MLFADRYLENNFLYPFFFFYYNIWGSRGRKIENCKKRNYWGEDKIPVLEAIPFTITRSISLEVAHGHKVGLCRRFFIHCSIIYINRIRWDLNKSRRAGGGRDVCV